MAGPFILLYHRVAHDPIDGQMLAVSPVRFEEQMIWLKKNYRVIPLRQLVAETADGIFDKAAVSITFDDGYADNLTYALPILERHELHATIFVTAGRVGHRKLFWWDALESILFSKHALPPVLSLPEVFGDLKWPVHTPQGRVAAYDHLSLLFKTLTPPQIEYALKDLQAWSGNEKTDASEPLPLTDKPQFHAAVDHGYQGCHDKMRIRHPLHPP